MPTKNPRIAITVPVHRYGLLKRLAALQGVSMASVITEFLEECYPALERVVMVLEAAKNASEEVREGVRQSCYRAISEITPYAEDVMKQSDLFFGEVMRKVTGDGAVGACDVGSAPAAPATVNPRVVTRGSGFRNNTPKRSSARSEKPVLARVSRK